MNECSGNTNSNRKLQTYDSSSKFRIGGTYDSLGTINNLATNVGIVYQNGATKIITISEFNYNLRRKF